MRSRIFLVALVVLVCGARIARAEATFEPLSNVYGTMSRNGQHVVTVQTGGAVSRWTRGGGQTALMNVGSTGGVSGVSNDGTIVAGYHRNAANQTVGFRWTAAGGFVDLGDLPGGSTFSIAYDMTPDGQTIVGDSVSTASSTRNEGFRWTAAGGMVALGDLPGGMYTSDALAISSDGTTIAGISNQTSGYEAYRWTVGGGMMGLGDIPGGFFNSQGYGISANGNFIVGYSYNENNQEEAFRWSAGTGLVRLGRAIPAASEWSQAKGVSADGAIVVGGNVTGPVEKALMWDEAHGMRYLQDVLRDEHGLLLAGWSLTHAWDVSDDGMTIAGSGKNPLGQSQSWVVTIVPEPGSVGVVVILGWSAVSSRCRERRLV